MYAALVANHADGCLRIEKPLLAFLNATLYLGGPEAYGIRGLLPLRAEPIGENGGHLSSSFIHDDGQSCPRAQHQVSRPCACGIRKPKLPMCRLIRSWVSSLVACTICLGRHFHRIVNEAKESCETRCLTTRTLRHGPSLAANPSTHPPRRRQISGEDLVDDTPNTVGEAGVMHLL